MAQHKVAVIKGDGIGVDVVDEVLNALAPVHGITWEWAEFPWSSGYYLTHGEMMPDTALDTLSPFDAIFLGAIGHPDIQDHITLNGLLLPIRRRLIHRRVSGSVDLKQTLSRHGVKMEFSVVVRPGRSSQLSHMISIVICHIHSLNRLALLVHNESVEEMSRFQRDVHGDGEFRRSRFDFLPRRGEAFRPNGQ